MRIIVTGDRFWTCHRLAAAILVRLVARYGPEIVVVHGGATGVDESFDSACRGLGVKTEVHPVTGGDWERLGKKAGPLRNEEMVRAGAGLCVALHRFLSNSKGTKDCVRRAVGAGIPTYLIDSDRAVPVRLSPGDPRLE
jgi:hypothetical protein